MIFKGILAIAVGWGALYAAQHYWLQMIAAQVAQTSPSQLFAPPPSLPAMEIDPQKLRLAINPPVVIDTKKYERLAIESQMREAEQRIRGELSKAPQPISIPGLRH